MFQQTIDGITSQRNEFYKWLLSQDESYLNSNDKLKYVLSYTMLLFEYAKDISTLIEQTRYSSVLSLCRDFLECYMHVQSLIDRFSSESDFNWYKEKIYVLELKQTQLTYKALKTDGTFQGQPSVALQKNLDWMKHLLAIHFPDEYRNLNGNDMENAILDAIKSLRRTYGVDNESIGKNIGCVLENNQTLITYNNGNTFDGCYTIYNSLCYSTHSNISTVLERTIDFSKNTFIPNTPQPNTETALRIIVLCLEDVKKNVQLLVV